MEFELLNMMNELEHDYMIVFKKLGIHKILLLFLMVRLVRDNFLHHDKWNYQNYVKCF